MAAPAPYRPTIVPASRNAAADTAGTRLVGHSGASLTLIEGTQGAIVRKAATDATFNQRLRRQQMKQTLFSAQGIATPAVLAQGMIDGLYHFDMRYVPGVSLAAQCASGLTIGAPLLAAFVHEWLERLRPTTYATITPDRFRTKIASVLDHSRANPVLRDALPILDLLADILQALDWPSLPESECHGDLTLENLLSGLDGRLHVIDFDTPDLSSYAMDVAKLYQDLSGAWCIRALAIEAPGSVAHLNAVMALRHVKTAVDAVVDDAVAWLRPSLPGLVSLNLLRTLPYCHDSATATYVVERIRAVLSDQAADRTASPAGSSP